jgi:hypothetical protein
MKAHGLYLYHHQCKTSCSRHRGSLYLHRHRCHEPRLRQAVSKTIQHHPSRSPQATFLLARWASNSNNHSMVKPLWHLSSFSNHKRSMLNIQSHFNINRARNNNTLKISRSSHNTLRLRVSYHSNTRLPLSISHQPHFSSSSVTIHHHLPRSLAQVHSTLNRSFRH